MSEYQVIYEGTIREVYIVEADSEDEARDKWPEEMPVHSEVTDGEVTGVTRL